MGLRLREGVELDHISRRSGLPADRLVDAAAADRMAALDLIRWKGARLTVTAAGMLLLDAILPEVVAI